MNINYASFFLPLNMWSIVWTIKIIFSPHRGCCRSCLKDSAKLQSSSGQEEAGDESHDWRLPEENGGREEKAAQTHSERWVRYDHRGRLDTWRRSDVKQKHAFILWNKFQVLFKCSSLTHSPNSNRNCIGSSKSCVRVFKEVSVPSQSWGQIPDVRRRGEPAKSWGPEYVPNFCLHSIPGEILLQFPLICTMTSFTTQFAGLWTL